jgi:hypothetical protein
MHFSKPYPHGYRRPPDAEEKLMQDFEIGTCSSPSIVPSRWVDAEILPEKTAANARDVRHRLVEKVPFTIEKILTDNGKEFTDRFCATGEREPTGRHLFDQDCARHGIEHRLIAGHRLALVNVAGRDPTCEPLATVVDDAVELDAIKPAHGVFAASGDLFKHIVDAAVVTDNPGGRIHEGNAGFRAVAGLEVNTQQHQGGGSRPPIASHGAGGETLRGRVGSGTTGRTL